MKSDNYARNKSMDVCEIKKYHQTTHLMSLAIKIQ